MGSDSLRISPYKNKQNQKSTVPKTDGWKDGWKDRQTDGKMDGQTGRQISLKLISSQEFYTHGGGRKRKWLADPRE